MCKGPEAGQSLACCQNSGAAVWLEQSEPRVEREKGRARRRLTQVTQGLGWDGGGVGGEDLGFYLPEVRALGVCGQKRAGPDPGVHSRPLVADAGRTDWWGCWC